MLACGWACPSVREGTRNRTAYTDVGLQLLIAAGWNQFIDISCAYLRTGLDGDLFAFFFTSTPETPCNDQANNTLACASARTRACEATLCKGKGWWLYALRAGAAAALLISLRYSARQPQYHIFTVPLAGWLIAHGTHIFIERHKQTAETLLLILALLAIGYFPAMGVRASLSPGPRELRLAELASELRSSADPDVLIVVRSLDGAYDPN
jgi:hypothetical protein